MKLNVELLLKVKRHILADPLRLRMDRIIHRKNKGKIVNPAWGEPGVIIEFPRCGTVACIAGWTNLLSGSSSRSMNEAGKRLGITEAASGELFLVTAWPYPLMCAYVEATTQHQRAKLAGQRIDAFIEEHGHD